jgi:two-component system, LytTR family, response regulator
MIKAIIIDDEPLAREIVKEYLIQHNEISVVQECGDGFEGVKAIAHHKPDLIFLDIQMPKINGFEMLELIDSPPSVIFTTAFDEYAIKAFEAHAVDYLLKPFSKDRFEKALQKWKEQYQLDDRKLKDKAILESVTRPEEEQKRVVVKKGNAIRIIPVKEIIFIEACDDYVKINANGENFLKKKTMQYFEDTLDAASFVRAHRSYILQINQITRIEPMEKDNHVALLKNGTKIPLSKTGYAKLKAVLGL